jgi:hypothetical protein
LARTSSSCSTCPTTGEKITRPRIGEAPNRQLPRRSVRWCSRTRAVVQLIDETLCVCPMHSCAGVARFGFSSAETNARRKCAVPMYCHMPAARLRSGQQRVDGLRTASVGRGRAPTRAHRQPHLWRVRHDTRRVRVPVGRVVHKLHETFTIHRVSRGPGQAICSAAAKHVQRTADGSAATQWRWRPVCARSVTAAAAMHWQRRAVTPVAPPNWRGRESRGLAAACPRDPHSQMATSSRGHAHESRHGLHEEVLELRHGVAKRGRVKAGDGRKRNRVSCASRKMTERCLHASDRSGLTRLGQHTLSRVHLVEQTAGVEQRVGLLHIGRAPVGTKRHTTAAACCAHQRGQLSHKPVRLQRQHLQPAHSAGELAQRGLCAMLNRPPTRTDRAAAARTSTACSTLMWYTQRSEASRPAPLSCTIWPRRATPRRTVRRTRGGRRRAARSGTCSSGSRTALRTGVSSASLCRCDPRQPGPACKLGARLLRTSAAATKDDANAVRICGAR